jgi:hypothetical protein
MAVRISELDELSLDLSQSDELPIVDLSAGDTKKITVGSLVSVGISGSPSGSIDLAKLNQSSATKLTATALSNTGVVAGTYGGANTVVQFSVNSQGLVVAASGISVATTANSVTGLAPVATSGTYQSLAGLPALGTLAAQDAGSVVISGGTVFNITDLAVADGGTGASSTSDARTNLGLAIGTNVQAYDAGLASIAGLTTSADKILYLTGIDTYDTSPLPIYARGFLASGNSSADARATLGLGALATRAIVDAGDINAGAVSGATIANGSLIAANYGEGSVNSVAISGLAITSDKIANDAVTAAKLANNSSSIVLAGAPTSSGSFIGQSYLDATTKFAYVWDGDSWERQSAISDITFAGSTPIVFDVTYPDDYSAVVTASLESQTAITVFAGPISGVATAPTFRPLQPTDLPIATAVAAGAVAPGTGLAVDGVGNLNHINTSIAGVYAGAVTIDAQGHVTTAQPTLLAEDIPGLDASKITTGSFSSSFLAENSVTASQLADYGIAQVSESSPTPEFAGQWWINPADRAAYIWVGEVSPVPNGYWLNLGYGSPTQINLRFGGTYNASGNVVESTNSYGTEAGLNAGQPLSAPSVSNNGVYLIVTTAGTGTAPAPAESLLIGNWVLSEGTGGSWTKVNLYSAVGGVSDQDVLVAGSSLTPSSPSIASQQDFNENVWPKVQIANASTAGLVRASSQILVASGTGIMSVGAVDDGSY